VAKKLFIKTYGCQMNVYDSARMADVLAPLGYAAAETPGEADMVILNTCHIREKAAEKVYSELGRLRRIKEDRAAVGERTVIAVAGCVAQAEGEEILRRVPAVDIVLGPQTYHRLPELVARATRAGGGVLDTEFPVDSKFDHLPDEATARGVSAFITVQEGCDKFCTFCVVPYTRGAEASRPAAAVIAEARRLVGQGTREITLLGQNVNAYRHADWSFARLIRALAELPGLARIRYTTSHPNDIDDDLVAAHAEVPALMPYLHLPVQSGSDRVLEGMNRRYTIDEYRRVIDRLRAARVDLAFSSDFIVGFPGETDGDFDATLRLISEIGYAQAYSFMYSPRPGTPAALLPGQLPEPAKAERLAMLQAAINRQQRAFNRASEGQVMQVLFDRAGRRSGQMLGRSPYMQSVYAAAADLRPGMLASVRIEGGHDNSLSGRVVGVEQRGCAA